MSTPRPAQPTRSRDGCRECRRLHRKCDEQRPHCAYCRGVGKTCSYNKPLSWGGRPFGKSLFGKALASGVVSIASTEDSNATDRDHAPSFVYSLTETMRSNQPDRREIPSRSALSSLCINSSTPGSLSLNPSWLSWISDEHRSLIDHFTNNLIPCFSLHPSQPGNFCSNFVPLAVDTTHGTPLLAAILISASVHRDSLSSPEHDIRLAKLYQTCIHHLRQKPLGGNAEVDDVYVATALILCLTEILAGGKKSGAWRMHLNGAAALLDGFAPNTVEESKSTSTRLFLWRWCRSLRANALASAQATLPSPLIQPGTNDGKAPDTEYIDVFDGFSTSLLPVFGEIRDFSHEATALRELDERGAGASQSVSLLRSMLHTRCDRLVSKIKIMSKQPVNKLDPLIPPSQQNDHFADFTLLNEVYHHTALLELYQRVLDKPQVDSEVQYAVKSGIGCLQQLTLNDHASPGVATLHPIFTIGCSVSAIEDRIFVLDWLESMRKRYSMGNVQSAKSFLLELWQRNDALKSTGSHIQWNKLMQEKDWDLSLY